MEFKNQSGKSGFADNLGVISFEDTFFQTVEERLKPLYDYRSKLISEITDGECPKVSDEHVESMKRQLAEIEAEIMSILIGPKHDDLEITPFIQSVKRGDRVRLLGTDRFGKVEYTDSTAGLAFVRFDDHSKYQSYEKVAFESLALVLEK